MLRDIPVKPSLPPRVADFIHRMNQHPHFLGVLGILPNQLRSLLKESGHEHREEFLLDLSQTLFFAGYRIWKKRQKLSLRYWKEVGQRQQQGITKRKKQKRKNMEEKMSVNQNVETLSIIFIVIATSRNNAPQDVPARMLSIARRSM